MVGSDGTGQHASGLSEPGGPELKAQAQEGVWGPELNREKEFWIKACIPASSYPKPGIQAIGLLTLAPSSQD